MSKHKTLADKKRSEKRKVQSHENSFSYISTKSSSDIAKIISDDELLLTDPKYIKIDLLRTLVLSLFFGGLLLGIFKFIDNGGIIPFLF